MSDDIYSTPTSSLDKNIKSEVTVKSSNNQKFKKTMIMNIIGGVCFSIMGVALYLNKMDSELGSMLIQIVIVYSILCASAFGSAYAVRTDAGSKIKLAMLIINWLLISIFIFGVMGTLIATWSNPDIMRRIFISLILGSLMFVIPQLINIRALNQFRKNR